MMLRGLSRAGLGNIGSDQQLIEKAAAFGFQSVDLDAAGLVKALGVDQARELLRQHHMEIGSIGLPVDWRGSEMKFRDDLPKLLDQAVALAALGGSRCCTYILPSTDLNAAHFMALATKRLRTCAQILGAYGIRLGLEFVGPHHLRTRWKHPFIWTMGETLDWIDAIGESNVGLLLDAYHWYTTEMAVRDIEALQASQIVHVHLNDAKDVAVEQVLDNDRMYPGEGVIDLVGFLQALQKIGYTGMVAQEILTPAPLTDAPDVLLRRSKEGYDKVFGAAGL
jgi:sugar phosphate isomerase/epimerase